MATSILQCICTTPALYMHTGYALYEHLSFHNFDQEISLLAMRGQSTPQLRDREWLNCVLLSPVILEELQEHSPYQPPHEMAQQVRIQDITGHINISLLNFSSLKLQVMTM